jgi:arginase
MITKTILTPYFLDKRVPGLEGLKEWDWFLNREPLPESTVIERMSVLHGSLANAVEEICVAGEIPVSIAGDCCAAIAMLAGLRRAVLNPLLIWFDAHGDFNTMETSPSGFLGGMPLAMLVGRGEQAFLEALDLDPIEEERVILTDGRDLDPSESELVTRSSVTHLRNPMDLMDYSFSDQPLWIHFDTDILDPKDVPAQNYPAPGGIRKDDLRKVFQYLAKTGLVCGISLSSWAPDLPEAEQSRDVCLALLEVLKQQ